MKCKHMLKTWPKYFQAVWDGKKNFEVRNNDRNFAIGDSILLREYKPRAKKFTSRRIVVSITYITDFGQPEGQVVFGFMPFKRFN